MRPDEWRRASELFERALDCAPASRDAWLASECVDENIRSTVRNWLVADALSGNFMERPTGDASPIVEPSTDESLAGTSIGAYRIVRLIGSGGMGEVWLAERNDGQFEKNVAIKRLLFPTPELVRDFRHERRVLARLQHPNIAQLFDGNIATDGTPYFVMEYVEGEPITAYCESRALDLPACIALFVKVCDAVQFAHRNLVVHRDLKPANILVGRDDEPKLLDFGIAKVLQASVDDDATATLMRRLTPDYASPEQILGQPMTTATDIYSLGVLLFEIVCGERPYRIARQRVGIEHAIVDVLPAAPSVVTGRGGVNRRTWAHQVRGDVDRIVLRAMAKEPERRYPTAQAFADDLRRFLAGRPILARGDDAVYRLRKFVGRNRSLAAATVIVVMAFFTATAVSLWQARRASHQARRAEASAASAQAVQDFMLDAFLQAEPWRNAGRVPNVLELAESAMTQIDARLAGEPAAKVKMYESLARLFSVAGDIRLSVVAARSGLDALQSMPGRGASQLHTARARLAYALLYNNDIDGAEREVAAMEAADPQGEEDRIGIATLHAMIARDRGRWLDFERIQRLQLPRTEAFYGLRSKATAASRWHLHYALEKLGRYGEALAEFDRHFALIAELYAVDAPQRMSTVLDIESLAAERDAPAAALAPARVTVARMRDVFGHSGYLAQALLALARIEHFNGHPAEALAALDEASAIFTEPAHADRPAAAACAVESAWVRLDNGRTAGVRASLEQALDVYSQAGGPDDPRALLARAVQARAAWLEHDDRALAELAHIAQRARGEALAELPEILDWQAATLRDAGTVADAIPLWHAALDTLDGQGRPLCTTSLRVHRALARALATSGNEGAGHEARVALAQTSALFGDEAMSNAADLLAIAGTRNAPNEVLKDARQQTGEWTRPGLRLVAVAQDELAGEHASPTGADERATLTTTTVGARH